MPRGIPKGRTKKLEGSYYSRNKDIVNKRSRERYLKKRELLLNSSDEIIEQHKIKRRKYHLDYYYKNQQKLSRQCTQYQRKRLRELKIRCITYKGGLCFNCGLLYNGKNACVFEFHHLDPNEKEVNIGKMRRYGNWERMKKEMDKCIMICSNCHKLEHHGGW